MKYSLAAAATLFAATVSAALAPGSFFSKASNAPKVGAILDIRGRVFLVQREVTEKQGFPSAVILEAQIDPKVPGTLVTDPETQLTNIHCVFRVEEKNYKSIEISSTSAESFGPVIPHEKYWMGSADYSIEKDLVYSVGDVYKTCRADGRCSKNGINSVTIRQPIHPKFNAPQYIFNTKEGHVFYSAKTGKYTDAE